MKRQEKITQERVLAANQKPIEARHFYIVGGGCFGTQYARWLLRAQRLGQLRFQKIFAIDRNPECRIALQIKDETQLSIVVRDWVEYLTEYLMFKRQMLEIKMDYWVPSPLSAHLIFLSFLEAAQRLCPHVSFQFIPFNEEVPTPVRIPLASQSLAVSFAEWECPVNCIEPNQCPAIRAPRTWDMKPALEGYFKASSRRSVHLLQCQHLVHGVGTIPMAEITCAFERFLEDLQKGGIDQAVVATVSRCHGIIGAAQVIERPNSAVFNCRIK